MACTIPGQSKSNDNDEVLNTVPPDAVDGCFSFNHRRPLLLLTHPEPLVLLQSVALRAVCKHGHVDFRVALPGACTRYASNEDKKILELLLTAIRDNEVFR